VRGLAGEGACGGGAQKAWRVLAGVFVFGASLLLYWFSLAPNAMDGDQALFQTKAYKLILDPFAQTHPLYVVLAHLFTLLPGGFPVAFKVNLLSAFAASGALVLLYLIGLLETGSVLAALGGALALMVAHSFWFHAAIAEVYTLNILLIFGVIYGLLLWDRRPERPGYLYLAAFLLGLSLTNHVLNGLMVPPVLVWLLGAERRGRLTPGVTAKAALGGLLGLAPLLVLMLRVLPSLGLQETLRLSLFGGTDTAGKLTQDKWQQKMLYFGLDRLLWKSAAAGALFLYQFFLLQLGFLALGVRRAGAASRARGLLLAVALLYVLFAVSYKVHDFWVFLLPAWAVLAVFISHGLAGALESDGLGLKGCAAVLVLFILLPVGLYSMAPRMVSAARIGLLEQRRQLYAVQGRDQGSNFFAGYFWPPQRGNRDYEWARDILEGLDRGALLVAFTPQKYLFEYLQVAEGVRPDVEVRWVPAREQTAFVASQPERPIYFCDSNPHLYRLKDLPPGYSVRRQGNCFRIVRGFETG
jgi:hypothetical protein